MISNQNIFPTKFYSWQQQIIYFIWYIFFFFFFLVKILIIHNFLNDTHRGIFYVFKLLISFKGSWYSKSIVNTLFFLTNKKRKMENNVRLLITSHRFWDRTLLTIIEYKELSFYFFFFVSIFYLKIIFIWDIITSHSNIALNMVLLKFEIMNIGLSSINKHILWIFIYI